MKFSDYYFAPGVKLHSLILGLMAGSACGMLLNSWQYGVLAGAGVALITAVLHPLRAYLADRPYQKIKDTLKKPFLLDQRVYFTVKNGTVGGFFVLTEHSMVFLSLERGTHRLELQREDVKRVVLDEHMTLSIFMSETKFVRVISAGCEEMYNVLFDNGWVPD